MELFLGWLFRAIGYTFFGLVMEVKSSSISAITDGEITEQDKKMLGHVSLYMVPVYSILLLFVFEFVNGLFPVLTPAHAIIAGLWWIIPIKFLVWSISITGFEVLSGHLYDKLFGIRPWNYTGSKGSILNGYTKWTLIPWWGLAGLIIEFYSFVLIQLTPCFLKIIF